MLPPAFVMIRIGEPLGANAVKPQRINPFLTLIGVLK